MSVGQIRQIKVIKKSEFCESDQMDGAYDRFCEYLQEKEMGNLLSVLKDNAQAILVETDKGTLVFWTMSDVQNVELKPDGSDIWFSFLESGEERTVVYSPSCFLNSFSWALTDISTDGRVIRQQTEILVKELSGSSSSGSSYLDVASTGKVQAELAESGKRKMQVQNHVVFVLSSNLRAYLYNEEISKPAANFLVATKVG